MIVTEDTGHVTGRLVHKLVLTQDEAFSLLQGIANALRGVRGGAITSGCWNRTAKDGTHYVIAVEGADDD